MEHGTVVTQNAHHLLPGQVQDDVCIHQHLWRMMNNSFVNRPGSLMNVSCKPIILSKPLQLNTEWAVLHIFWAPYRTKSPGGQIF